MGRHLRWTAAASLGTALGGALGAAPSTAGAQQPTLLPVCTGPSGAPLEPLAVTIGANMQLPPGTTALTLTTESGTAFTDPERKLSVPVSGAVWTPDESDIAALTLAMKHGVTTPAEAPRLKLTFGVAGPQPCLVAYTTPLPMSEFVQPTKLPTLARAVEGPGVPVEVGCRMAGDSVERALKRDRRRGDDADPVVVLFEERGPTSTDGRPCYLTRGHARQGDALHVGVYTIAGHTGAPTWTGVQFDPCAEEALYPVYAGLTEGPSGQQAVADYSPAMFAPRHCFSTRTTITVTGAYAGPGSSVDKAVAGKSARNGGADSDGEDGQAQATITVTHKHTLEQARLYAATLQAGVLVNGLQSPSFGLRPGVTADTQRVFNEGPVNGGPVYVATVVIYGFLHHIPSIFGKPRYRGRDPLHDTGLVDRLSLVAGAGLPKPGENFFGGASFEIVAGVNVLGGWHVARVTELAGGIKEGDIFEGDAATIPTQTTWKSGLRWGVSLDLRYLGRLLPTGG